MSRLAFSRPAILLVALPLALAACSSPREPIQVDRVERPVAAQTPDVLSPERLLIEGSAAWTETTVGDLMARRAVTATERARAERTLASGAYLGDPAYIVRLTPADVTEGLYQAGTAYLLAPFSPEAPPQPFEMSMTFEMKGGDGASAGLSIELRDPSGAQTGGVGQMLITLMDPGTDTSAQLTVSTRGVDEGDAFEPVASVPLARRDWRGAHRLDLAYTPGSLAVRLDGELLETAPVRLDRPAGPVYVGAFASTPTMGVTLLHWTFSSR